MMSFGVSSSQATSCSPAEDSKNCTPRFLKVVVHIWIMNHLTQEEDAAVVVLVEDLIGNFDGVFDAKAKAKMASQDKPDGTKVEHARSQILFAWVV